MDYAIHLAERLSYDILTVAVKSGWHKGPIGLDRPGADEAFKRRAVEAGDEVRRRSAQRGIHCEHVVRYGDLGTVVEDLIHKVKRVEFVVTESESDKAQVAGKVTVPVFNVISSCETREEGALMAGENGRRKKPVAQTLAYGLCTAGLYAAVFTHAGALMTFYTKGGWYAALPVGTAIVFSLVHGAFASNLWSVLGIEARKTDVRRQTVSQTVRPDKRARKRPRMYAYINPFHRI